MAVSATAILIGTAIAGAIGGSVGTVMVQDEWVATPHQSTAPQHYQSTAPQGAPYDDPGFRKYYYDREGNIHYVQ